LPEYVLEAEAIEGDRIYCEFEDRPSFGIEKKTKRSNATITGNPAVASILKVWKYIESTS